MATSVALISSILSLVVSLVSLGAVTEVVRRAKHEPVNEQAQVSLLPTVTREIVGKRPQELGLPNIDSTRDWLFLSPRCPNCAHVAASLKGEIPVGVSVVLTAIEHADPFEWIAAAGLRSDEVTIDHDRELATRLLLLTSPAIVASLDEELVFAAAVSGPEGFRRITEDHFLPPEAFTIRHERNELAQQFVQKEKV